MFQGIYFDDNSVNVEIQVLAFLVPEIDEILYFLYVFTDFGVFRNFETPSFCLLKQFEMRFGRTVFAHKLIEYRRKISLSYFARILQFQTSRSSISRVHKSVITFCQSLFINFVEVVVRKINFATHVKSFWEISLQLKRNIFDGLYIGSDFITLETITSGYRLRKLSVFKQNGNRSAVIFQFGDKFYVFGF